VRLPRVFSSAASIPLLSSSNDSGLVLCSACRISKGRFCLWMTVPRQPRMTELFSA
jgi:hypothetical protein